ncbi:MAG: NAD(P)/FAD-dependent oxidoreductase [Ruthenibacterium sp.]
MYDCIIVGGGPAGLSAGINLKQRGKDALILNQGISLLEKAERVDNYLGLPALSGTEMMAVFKAHAAALGVETKEAKAANIMPFDGHFMVNADGDILESHTVILATGVAKAKPIAGEAELLGRGVSYCATCDGMLYKGRNVAVWGSASDVVREANFLADIGCHVTLIAAKRPEALRENIAVAAGGLQKIEGEQGVTGVMAGGNLIAMDCVFILRSALPPDALLPGLALQDGSVVINAQCETNLPGVFAAGDLTGKPLQVANAVGEGLVAALRAAEFLDK